MSSTAKKIVGWGLIAAIAAICFALNELRAQFLYFNWFRHFYADRERRSGVDNVGSGKTLAN